MSLLDDEVGQRRVAGRAEGTMTTNIKLYGSKDDRFQTIKSELEEALGYEPSNTEVVGILMAEYKPGQSMHPAR